MPVMHKNQNAFRTLARAVVDAAFQDLERSGMWHDDAMLFFEDRQSLDLFCGIGDLDPSDAYTSYRRLTGKSPCPREIEQEEDGGTRIRIYLRDRHITTVDSILEVSRATGLSDPRIRQLIRSRKATRMGYRFETSDPVLCERRKIRLRLRGKPVGDPKGLAMVMKQCRIPGSEALRLLREGGETADGYSLEWAT